MVSSVGIQAGAFLKLSDDQATGQAIGAYGASFTDALHTCALVGGIGILVAALIALALIGIRSRDQQEQTEPRIPAQSRTEG